METRMEEALTEQASTVATAIEKLNAGIISSQTMFAQAVRAEQSPETSTPRTQAPSSWKTQTQTAPPPMALLEIVLAQGKPGGKAELESKASFLAGRINFILAEACSPDPPVVRALRKVHRTGEIILQFNDHEHARVAQEQSPDWLPLLNPDLKIKVKLYTIMIHGIPTTFNVNSTSEVQDFMEGNKGLLDSLQTVRWADPHSILISKPYSSIFVSLSDPKEANAAIYNKINFEGELKTTKRSKKHAGASQCFKCQVYGHHQSNCPSEPCCAHCADSHETQQCKRDIKATQR